MREFNEKQAAELIENIEAAMENCRILNVTTGDENFRLMSMLLKTALIAKANGDLLDIMEAVAGVIDRMIMSGQDATADVVEDPRFAPSIN